MTDHAVHGPFESSAIPHVGTYRRLLPVSLARLYENALDWAHLPWLHASSFSAIECLDSGAWGWRAEVLNARGERSVIELRLDRGLRRWITRNLEGPNRGAEIWTHAFELDHARVDINVDFFVPDVPHDARAKVGRAYAAAYATLYDEDVAMMVARQRALDTRMRALQPGEQVVGAVADVKRRLGQGDPVIVGFGERRFRIVRADDAWAVVPVTCPHQLGPLDTVPVEGRLVRCPWHGYVFDVISGEGVAASGCHFGPRPAAVERGDELVLRYPPGS